MKIPIFDFEAFEPLQWLGLKGTFWQVHVDTVLFTWLAMLILFGIVIVARIFLKRKLSPFSLMIEQSVDMFVGLAQESFGYFRYDYFAFIASLFFFVLFCNLVGSLPFIEEPTRDLNTALACGITGFLYVQYQCIRTKGGFEYFKNFAKPIFILFPLNVIGELAKAASMSFRLFGNILGGSIVLYILIDFLSRYKIYIMGYAIVIFFISWIVKYFVKKNHKMLHKVLSVFQYSLFAVAGIQIFFGAFEAVIQAFVITMLVTTYLSIETQEESGESCHEHVTHKVDSGNEFEGAL